MWCINPIAILKHSFWSSKYNLRALHKKTGIQHQRRSADCLHSHSVISFYKSACIHRPVVYMTCILCRKCSTLTVHLSVCCSSLTYQQHSHRQNRPEEHHPSMARAQLPKQQQNGIWNQILRKGLSLILFFSRKCLLCFSLIFKCVQQEKKIKHLKLTKEDHENKWTVAELKHV